MDNGKESITNNKTKSIVVKVENCENKIANWRTDKKGGRNYTQEHDKILTNAHN